MKPRLFITLIFSAVCVFAVFCLFGCAKEHELSISPQVNTYIFGYKNVGESPDLGYKDNNQIVVDSLGKEIVYGYINFDLSSIPKNAKIKEATLHLFILNVTPSWINIRFYEPNINLNIKYDMPLFWLKIPAMRHIATEKILNEGDLKWQTFDITDTVDKWVKGRSNNNELIYFLALDKSDIYQKMVHVSSKSNGNGPFIYIRAVY